MVTLLAVVLFVGGLTAMLLRSIGLAAAPAYLISGMLLTEFHTLLPGSWHFQPESIEPFMELGLMLLMFGQGLELSTAKLIKMGGSTFLLGLSQSVATALAVALVWSLTHGYSPATLAIAGALAFSSTGSIVKYLEEHHLMRKPYGKSVIGVLLLEDVLAIFVMVALPTLAIGSSDVSLGLVATQLLVVTSVLWLAGGVVGPRLTVIGLKRGGTELLLILSLGLCLMVGEFFMQKKLSPALGAFMVGMLLAETKEIAKIRNMIEPIKQLFVAIFFVGFGMKFDPRILTSGALGSFILLPAILFGKFMVPVGVGLWNKKSFSESFHTALMLPQIGEFSIIIGTMAAHQGIISQAELSAIMVVSLCSLTFVPWVLGVREALFQRIDGSLFGTFSRWFHHAGETFRTNLYNLLVNLGLQHRSVKIATKMIQKAYLKTRTLSKSSQLSKLVPWNERLIELTAESGSPAIGRALIELGIRDRYGVNLVAIERDGEVYVSPEPSFRILPWDIILIYGDEEQAEKAEKMFHRGEKKKHSQTSKLADCTMQHLKVSPDHPFIGKTIRSLDLRAQYGVMVLAVLRNGVRERNPSPDFEFSENDKIYYVSPSGASLPAA
jgi:Kef-type K+ transport system membrane component KefB/uncharacterized protein with PhoU and TrkA domain